MKKLFASVLVGAMMLMGTNAFAQLSVGGGYINSTETSTYTVGNTSTSSKADLNGFYVGGQYNIKLVKGLGIAPGLYFSGLFGKRTDNYYITTGEAKFTELSINVPVNVNYTFELGRDLNLIAYAGPNFQYGVSCKGTYALANTTTTTNYYDEDHKRNPFNIYIGGGVGIQAGPFQVILGYDHSLTNMIKMDNVKVGRSQIKIGAGYAF